MGKPKKTQQRLSGDAGNATDRKPVTLDESGNVLRPPPPGLKRRHHVKLTTIEDIKTELARLYRQARAGEVAPQDATRMGYLLNLIANLIEVHDLERRVQQLEDLTAKGERS